MGILSTLLGGGGIKAIGDAVDKFVTTDEERIAGQIALRKLDLDERKIGQANELAQIEVNKEEAKHASVFVAGWRPFIGWVCGAGVGYHFLIYPLFAPLLEAWTGAEFRELDWGELSMLVGGLLGFGGLRTFEKTRGIATMRAGK